MKSLSYLLLFLLLIDCSSFSLPPPHSTPLPIWLLMRPVSESHNIYPVEKNAHFPTTVIARRLKNNKIINLKAMQSFFLICLLNMFIKKAEDGKKKKKSLFSLAQIYVLLDLAFKGKVSNTSKICSHPSTQAGSFTTVGQ